jgi:general secretion pathway protein D
MIIEVSDVSGFVGVAENSQPIIATRTISSNIRLKDGETNLLAGLFRNDKTEDTDKLPFLGDIPILGRLFSKTRKTNTTRDLVLTLTPHIVRIPDITEADLSPVYVGTDANISFQGTPRIESPGGVNPFDFQRREPPRAAPPPPAVTPVPQNPPPGALPNDPFRPPTPPPQSPFQAVPPQKENALRPPGALSVAAEEPADSAHLDFDPSVLSFARGEERSLLVRASGKSLPGGEIVIRFDPAVVVAIDVRPILSDGGVADARLEAGRIVLNLPAAAALGGTRAVAEVVFRGVAPGRSTLSFEKPVPGGAFALSEAVLEVR